MGERPSYTIGEAIREAGQILQGAGIAEARREAASLLAHTLDCDRTFLITHLEDALAQADLRRFHEYIERRASGEPLQYIMGQQEFYGLDFEVTPDVLIPRPETELIVEKALELLDETRDQQPFICDVGTGSGCISIVLLHERARARAVGLDISVAALLIARRNSERHKVNERLRLIASDCFAALNEKAASFSLIVSNPPYVDAEAIEGLQREVREHEPRMALTPGPDGLRIIRRLLADAPGFLKPGGHLLMEIGFNQHAAIEQLLDPLTWQLLDIHKDLQGIPRTVALRKR